MRSQDTLDEVESLRTNETRRGCHSLVVYTCYHYSTGLIQQNGVVDATVIFGGVCLSVIGILCHKMHMVQFTTFSNTLLLSNRYKFIS